MSAPLIQDRGRPTEQRIFAAAVVAVLTATVYVRRTVDPLDPVAWSYQVLALCLVVACIAGRALIGRHRAAAGMDLSSPSETPVPQTSSGDGSPEGRAPRGWPAAAIWAALGLAALLPYLGSLRVGLLSDDFGLVYAMSKVGGPLQAMRDRAYGGLFRPLSLLVYWLGVRLWQGSGIGYHAVSIAFHVANTLLVYSLGKRWIGSTYGAAVAAGLFAVHPLHVEAVVWIPSHSDLLYTGFGLASLLCLESYLTPPPPFGRSLGRRRLAEGGLPPAITASTPRRWLALAGVLLFFTASLLGKEAAIALPAAALLRLALLAPKPSRSQAVSIAAVCALPVIPYLQAYSSVVGSARGYRVPLTFWNTIFPSTPLTLMGDFLFPVHRLLFAEAAPALWWLALLLMAAGALWWTRGLHLVPAERLLFWIGFIFVLAIPVWVYSASSSAALEASRRAYFPTLGLAWLFGDVCAAKGLGLRKSGAIAAATILLAGLLTPWYIFPWRQAGRLARQVLSAGATFVQDRPRPNAEATIYVSRLPEMAYGVPVFRNCFPQAISFALGRNAPIRVVTDTPSPGSIHPEAMARWALQPGELLIAWDPKKGKMTTLRTGPQAQPRQERRRQ